MKKNALFTEKYLKRMSEIFLSNAIYMYMFDVTTGIVEEDIMSSSGVNYTKAYGLTSPCRFDEVIERSFDENYLHVEYTLDSSVQKLSSEELLNVYKAGKRRVEAKVYMAEYHKYSRIIYMLDKDEETGHVICYVLGQDITELENQWIRENQSALKELEDRDAVLTCAGIGIWYISLFDNEKPRMKASEKMCELLGIRPGEMTEEEIYEHWHGRIKKSSLPMVDASVSEMIKKGISENTYVWKHPVLGEIYVRCGGTSQYVKGKGYILRGYHSDVTDAMNSDMKQRQLLADALEETKKQKAMLQEALDNYKQADYDRRTDFLTGLHSRQDMFELLQDSLSGKRDSIQAMFMMDIDNFKLLNDRYGHTYGDECLKRIGNALTDYGKKNHMYFYRYGGEEMLGISFQGGKPERETAEELVSLVSGLRIERDDVETGVVTVSLGYTGDNRRYEKMIDCADAAMYHAKANGKNRAVCYEDLQDVQQEG